MNKWTIFHSSVSHATSESIKTLFHTNYQIFSLFSVSFFNSKRDKMKRLSCGINIDLRKCLICYMCFELCVWIFMTYSAVYHGKIFDHNFCKTEEFVTHVNDASNWYYNLIFGHLNFTTNIEQQKNIQGKIFDFGVKIINSFIFVDSAKCDTLNSLLVFVFLSYFIFTIFFLAGLSKVNLNIKTRCNLITICPLKYLVALTFMKL